MESLDQIDSRQYRFGFFLRGAEDVPPDFELPGDLVSFRCGLLLPRDDSGFWGHSLYPARVVLLRDDEIVILAHPVAQQPRRRIQIADLETVESGGILLLGWIGLYWNSSELLLSYNRRTHEPVNRFLARVRDILLVPSSNSQQQKRLSAGDELDLKFRNALSDELDGEGVALQLFQRPCEQERRVFGLLRRSWRHGDLLAITDRRLLWITDRYRGCREPYGVIIRYTGLHNVADCSMQEASHEIRITLRSGRCWAIPAYSGLSEARRFAEEAGRFFAGV